MTLVPHRVKRKGHEYYELVEEKWVNGKVVQKYAGYLGKSPNSKVEITGNDMLAYVFRLMKKDLSDVEIEEILKKIGIDFDLNPIKSIVLENDRKLNKIFVKLK